MSAEAIRLKVLNFEHYRKAPFKKHEGPLDQPRYFCVACDGDSFKLMADGVIRCTSCSARINNIRLMDIA